MEKSACRAEKGPGGPGTDVFGGGTCGLEGLFVGEFGFYGSLEAEDLQEGEKENEASFEGGHFGGKNGE